jgi:hypothetical protein
MSEFETSSAEFTPNNPRLFNKVLRELVRIAVAYGVDAPARELTAEDYEQDGPYNVNDPLFAYNVWPHTSHSMDELGISNDSKIITGILGADDAEGHRIATITVLGEGPSMKFGEYGSISTQSDDLLDGAIYSFKDDGVVTLNTYIFDIGTNKNFWDPTRQTTDEELAELVEGVEAFVADTHLILGPRQIER